MKKWVNGRYVDINNIELFNKALDDKHINSKVYNTIDADIESIKDINLEIMDEVIKTYKIIYNALPYPLYDIECDMKYIAIAEYIKKCLKDKIYDIWVDGGLYVKISDKKDIALKFIRKTWAIVNIDKSKDSNLDILKYKGKIGYEEFKWVIDIIKNGSKEGFYNKFMSEFVQACNNDKEIIKRELNNIMSFKSLPDKINLKSNIIINLDDNVEIVLDIYYKGIKETGEKEYILSLSDDIVLGDKYEKVYRFNYYIKEYEDGNPKKLVSVKELQSKLDNRKGLEEIPVSVQAFKNMNLSGIYDLFNMLCAIRINDKTDNFREFKGVIKDNYLIYQISDRLFYSKAYKADTLEEIDRGVEFYSYSGGNIYYIKRSKLTGGIIKEYIYYYNIKSGVRDICDVRYVGGV